MKPKSSLRRFLFLAGSSLLALSSASAQSGTWNVDANGLWGTAGNWTPGIADGSGNTANFTNNITADRTVSLDSDRTLTSLIFSDSNTATAGSWILDNNGDSANNLILDGTTPGITVNALGTGKTATISAIIEGSAGLVKSGSGTLILSGANTFTGATTVSAGTLRLSHANAVSDSSGVRLGNGTTAGTLNLTTNSTIKALTLIGASSTVTGSFNLDFSSGGTILHEDSTGNRAGSITSGITGSPTVTVTAGETLTLNPGSLTQTLGAMAVNPRVSGTADNGVTLDGSSTGNSIGNITQSTTNNSFRTTLSKNGTGTWTVGTLAGVHNSRIRLSPNAGRLIVTGDIYGVELAMGAGGTLELQKSGNLFTTTGSASNTITQLRGTIDNTSGGLITIASNPAIALTGDFTHAGNNINMGSGTVTLNATRQITVSNAASTLTFGGVISGATFGLTKAGAGTLELRGINTYNGTTAVNAGTLNVSAGNINSSTAINVAAGGTLRYNSSTALTVEPSLAGAGTSNRAVLGGTGTINATITLNDVGDVLSPGNSPGIQAFTPAQTWSSFSYDWEVNNFTGTTAGTDFDQITGSSFTLTGGSGSYILNVLGLTAGNVAGLTPNFSEVNRSWTILTASASSTFDAANWTINTAGFNSPDTGTWALAQSGNDLVLSYTVIPEPGAAFLGGLGVLVLLRRRRV